MKNELMAVAMADIMEREMRALRMEMPSDLGVEILAISAEAAAARERDNDFATWVPQDQARIALASAGPLHNGENGSLVVDYDGKITPDWEEYLFPGSKFAKAVDEDLSEELRELLYHGTAKEVRDALEFAADEGKTVKIDGKYLIIDGELQFSAFAEDYEGDSLMELLEDFFGSSREAEELYSSYLD